MVVVALVLIVVFRYSPYELAAHTDDPAFDYETAMVHHVRDELNRRYAASRQT